MKYFLSDTIGMLITLFLIRIFSFLAATPNNFDNLWRPRIFDLFPTAIIVILFLLIAYVLYRFTKELGSTDNRIKTHYFAYIGISYIFLSLFNRTILNFPFSYLYLLQHAKVGLEAIAPSLLLDLFFEPPYIFWALLLMGIVFVVCRKHNHIEYAIPFWAIPIAFIFCVNNDAIITMHFCGCLMALLGFKFSKGHSSIIVTVLQLIAYTGLCIYLHFTYYNDVPFLGAAMETMAIFFVPGLLITYKCMKSHNNSAIAATWIIPGLTQFFIITPMLRLPPQYNLVTLAATINSLLFTGNICIAVAVIVMLSIIINKLIPGSGKFCSRLLFAFTIVFYIIDGILFYYSQMRPDYHTLSWTLTMNDICRTTIATCAEYFTTTSLIIIALVIAIVVFTAIKGHKIIQSKPALATTVLILLATAQFGTTLIQSTTNIPMAMHDPFYELLKSLPEPAFLAQSLSMDEIREGLKECQIPLQEYTEKAPSQGNRTNVVLITLESLHWRYMNMFGNATQTFPLLSKLQDRMEIFPYMFSNFPESTSGDYAIITSLVPYDHLYLSKKNTIHKSLVNELKKAGYNTSMFSSGSVNDGNMINLTRTLPFDYFFHYNSTDTEYRQYTWNWGYKEEFTTAKILEYLKKQSTDQPHFVWYRTVYPHSPFPVFDKKETLVFKNPDKKPGEIDFITNYKNAMIYLDRVLSKFIEEIDELDRKNNQKTIIFMVSDHGEMLGEPDNHNQKGHGIYLSPQLTDVTAILIKPDNEGLKVNKNVCSQIDVVPTIMDYLNLEPAIQRYAQGHSLLKPVDLSRPIYLSSSFTYALIENGYYFEFPDKENCNAKVFKLAFTNHLKAAFLPVEKWDEKDLQNKLERTRKFYKLQQQLLNKL